MSLDNDSCVTGFKFEGESGVMMDNIENVISQVSVSSELTFGFFYEPGNFLFACEWQGNCWSLALGKVHFLPRH